MSATVEAVTVPATEAAKKIEVDPAKLRNLKIKSGVVKRYMKDLMSYRKEVTQQKAKIEKFKEEGKEELFLRQQVGCLRESEMLIPDISNRLTLSQKDLKELMEEDIEGLKQTEEFKAAQSILNEAENYVRSTSED